MNKPQNVLVLFLTFGEDKQRGVLDFILPLFESCTDYQFDIIKVDNKTPKDWKVLFENRKNTSLYEAPGDNTFYEMSGWSSGYTYASEKLSKKYSLVFFLNDALLNSKPTKHIKSINNELLNNIDRFNGVAGFVDSFARVSPEPINTFLNPIEILGQKTRWWICSTLVILKKDTFDKVLPITEMIPREKIYFENYNSNLFKKNAPVSFNYQQFLINHQTKKWYKKYNICEESYPLFKLKTECIMCEHYLSVKLKKESLFFVDLAQNSKRHGRFGRILVLMFGSKASFIIKVCKTYFTLFKEQIRGLS
jgi:hypothetical protein